MKAADVKRAQQVVDGLAQIALQRSWQLAAGSRCTISVWPQGGTQQAAQLGVDATKAAFNAWHRELDAREAHLRRTAAQIGLQL